ncbi:hypothetical protein M2163_000137 [Streptomyces sp. SAI-135]|jgi:hypothetical protein|nr:hypothetical protein [Streptomyces sp. SAI-090]MDH6554982.1 hypothetical protein [Streptomyces sp. SAI-041]MDH6574249.1 hypothetical protein [Streptomyces sp. SAI-117]MDH6581019.1 hypothetical protein [Streptomyces sp. SAI-133]MDH6613029.1 hypothetical protein [Streptomyces sp. SAI-135]
MGIVRQGAGAEFRPGHLHKRGMSGWKGGSTGVVSRTRRKSTSSSTEPRKPGFRGPFSVRDVRGLGMFELVAGSAPSLCPAHGVIQVRDLARGEMILTLK